MWWLADDPTLPEELKLVIDRERDVYVSPVSVWEVAIKQELGKLEQPTDLPERMRDSEFRELPIRMEHAVAAGRLPAVHRDPFDRMLVAQALCEDLTLMTRDRNIQQYEASILPV
jgi:PIN domain nuclease of toxin-antitoxin system